MVKYLEKSRNVGMYIHVFTIAAKTKSLRVREFGGLLLLRMRIRALLGCFFFAPQTLLEFVLYNMEWFLKPNAPLNPIACQFGSAKHRFQEAHECHGPMHAYDRPSLAAP
jgi:hypothetical protein